MLLKSGKRHREPHTGWQSPLVERFSKTECYANMIMNGSTIEKLGAILDVVRAHDEGSISRGKARPILLGALQDDSRQVRWSAVYALGQMDDLRGLLEGVSNECKVVRSMSTAMIYATLRKRKPLGAFHPNEFMERLIETMARNTGSEDKSVAIYSASALSEAARRDPVSVIRLVSQMKESASDSEMLARLLRVEMAAQESLTEIASRNRA
jgi:HEAT repeat protein